MDLKNKDLMKSEFFNSLPVHIKESIMQSGIDFKDENELKKFAAEIGWGY